jgi:outer membrane lipase/esterase
MSLQYKLFFLFLLPFSVCNLQGREVFSNPVFFGDGYTDIGNVPGSPFTGTRQNWTSVFGQKYGYTIQASRKGGSNYAYSLSLTEGGSLPSIYVPLDTQVNSKYDPSLYLSKDPVFVWSGTNDIATQNITPYSPETTASHLASAVETIKAKRALTVLIVNQFNLGKAPKAGIVPFPSESQLSAQVIAQNQALYRALSEPVFVIDLYSLFNDIIANPSRYGFTNVTDASPAPFGTPGYLFLPSIATAQPFTMPFHQIFGDYVFAIFEGAQASNRMNEMAFSLLRNQNQVYLQQLYPARQLPCVGTFYPFVSGQYAPQMQPIMTGSFGDVDSQSGNITVGLMDRFAEDWMIGAGGGVQLAEMDMSKSNVSSSFEQSALIGSLCLSYVKERGYVTALGSLAWLRINSYNRIFHTGPAKQKAHGHTKGKAYDLHARGAYFVYSDPSYFQTGPLVSVDFMHSYTNQFRERGSNVGNLIHGKNHLSNFTTGFGWECRLNRQTRRVHWVLDLTAEANYQWLGKDREVRVKEASLPVPFGTFYVAGDPTWYGSLGANSSLTFNNRQTLSFGYHLNIGENHIRESVINTGYAF